MICFQISIFEPLETTMRPLGAGVPVLWFAFKLVSLNHWKQRKRNRIHLHGVVICFQISIFEPLETTQGNRAIQHLRLWFAFKLVSLNHWKQPRSTGGFGRKVVICFQISIFEPLETTHIWQGYAVAELWFAFKLVSLNHWKQLRQPSPYPFPVVICFQISIFEPLETTETTHALHPMRCDLLSN